MIGNIVNISETSVKYYINPKYKECQKEYRQKIAVKDKSPKLHLIPGG